MIDLGQTTSIEVLSERISLKDKFVIDAGCGDLSFTKPLVQHGVRVLAIDPDPVQAKKNRAAKPIPNLQFVEAGADKLPTQPHSVDGVIFSYSLHHVPAELYPSVFAEVLRVLKPMAFFA